MRKKKHVRDCVITLDRNYERVNRREVSVRNARGSTGRVRRHRGNEIGSIR